MSLQPDPQAALDFLARIYPEGPWVLHSIAFEGGVPDKGVFKPGQEDDLAQWILQRNQDRDGKRNIYFSVNLPTPEWIEDSGDRKAFKHQIAEVSRLHVDLDPPRWVDDMSIEKKRECHVQERKRLLSLLTDSLPDCIPQPAAIVDSGGGYWGFWTLNQPIRLDGTKEDADNAALYSKRLQELFGKGADSCHNVDRIARLPGTVNWASNDKSTSKGQIDRLATCEQFTDDVYAIEEFSKAPGKVHPQPVAVYIDSANVERFESVDDISELQDVSDKRNEKCRVCIVQGHDLDDPPKSRSEPLFFVCCQMIRAGCSDDDIYSVITDLEFKVSDSVYTEKNGRARRNPERYAIQQIENAHDVVAAESEDFETNDDGRPYANLHNARLAIAKLGVGLKYNEFADRALITGLSDFGPYLSDAAVTRLWLAIEETFKLTFAKDKFWAIVSDMAQQNKCHPVREFLDSLTWDGTPRLDGWLSRYLGVEESEYARAIGTIVLIAAVRRVRQPGCKFDEMMVLEGPQGGRKSTALAVLAIRPEWFSDDLPLNAKAQQFIEQTVGKWIVEAGELEGLRKGSVEALKSCLSRQRDRSRMAYGRLPVERDRQFVIVGTTNKSRYLKDPTGGRRFWPVRVGCVDIDLLKSDVAQLWAEAAARELEGESIGLDPSLYGAAAEEQDARHIEDPWLQVLRECFGDLEGKIQTKDVWDLVQVPIERREQEHNDRLGEAMRGLGWERTKRRFGGPKPENCYIKGDASRKLVVVRGSVYSEDKAPSEPF